MNLLLQVASVIGATLILLSYFALQRHWWSSHDWAYLWCNLIGATLLTVVATMDRRIGFILLESVWALVTLQTMAGRGRSRSIDDGQRGRGGRA